MCVCVWRCVLGEMFCEVWPLQMCVPPWGARAFQTEADSRENQTPCRIMFPKHRRIYINIYIKAVAFAELSVSSTQILLSPSWQMDRKRTMMRDFRLKNMILRRLSSVDVTLGCKDTRLMMKIHNAGFTIRFFCKKRENNYYIRSICNFIA